MAIATLAGIDPFAERHRKAAAYEDDWEINPKHYAWLLTDISPIEPIPVKGKFHLFDVTIGDAQIKRLSVEKFDSYAFARGLKAPMPEDDE